MKTKPVSKAMPAVKSSSKDKGAGSELNDDDPGKVMGGTKTGEMLSNISKIRSEISQTFARNARG
jgi:hypothetical protein